MARPHPEAGSRGNEYPIPASMKAWVLGGPEELCAVEKPVPEPGPTEVLVRVDAIAVCATDIEIIRHGVPAMIDGGLPFNRGFTPGHEDRKSTRLNSSHANISYAVFCLKKKKQTKNY